MTEFFAMGGYAAYVWTAFGVAGVVMAGLLLESLRAMRATQAELELLEAGRPRRRDRRAPQMGAGDDA